MLSPQNKKFVILGNGCSGKSTIANKIGNLLGISVFHLDDYYWDNTGKRIPPIEWKKIHSKLIKKTQWVIEGTQQKHINERIKSADLCIFLDFPLLILVYRLSKKHIKKNKENGFPIRKGFIKNFLWLVKFQLKLRKPLINLLKKEQINFHILKSKAEIRKFLS